MAARTEKPVYAAWLGEQFLIVDTLEAVCDYLGVTKATLQCKASPSGRKRADNSDTMVYVMRLEDE